MQSAKTGLLWLLCAADTALGLWLAQVFVTAAHDSGAGRIVTLQNTGYILLVALLFIAPANCYLLRARTSLTTRLLIAASPIALFLALGGTLWVRLV
jgi:hypothetical protein